MTFDSTSDSASDSDSYSDSASKSYSESDSNSDSDTVAASATRFFAPSKSMPACSHHRRYTLAPGRRVARSQRSRIGHVAIYCVTVFCLLVTNFLIPSKPAYPNASARGGYSQLPSTRLRSCFPVILRVNLCWKLSRARSILGASAHISDPNSNNEIQ